MTGQARRLALRVSLIYGFFAAAWILASDQLIGVVIPRVESATAWQTTKGLAFVAVTSLLLFSLLDRILSRWEREVAERRRAEAVAEAGRDRLQRVLDGLFAFVAVLFPDGVIQEINRAPVELAGLTREDVIGKSFVETYWWSHSEPVRRRLQQYLASAAEGRTVRGDIEARGRGEELVPIDFVVRPLLDAEGRVEQLVASAVEITERKRTEDALRDSEERFRQLAENIHEVFWLTDTTKNEMLYISPAYERIWGRSRDGLRADPTSWVDAIHADDRERIFEAALTRQTAGTYDEVYRIVRPDGTIRWIHDRAFPVRNDAGEVYRVVGVAEDITVRYEAEVALRRSEARLRAILDGAAIGIAVVNADGRVIQCNPALTRMLGYSADDLVGMTFADFSHPDDIGEIVELFRSIAADEREQYEIEKRFLHREGAVVWGHLTVSMVRLPDHAATHAIGMVEDITARRELEEQYRQAQKMEAVGQLAGGVAHDFNNLLTIIQGNASVLAEGAEHPETREHAEDIQQAAERAADLTRQLLLFSRKQVFRPTLLDLNDVVARMSRMLQRVLGSDIALDTDCALQLQPVRADVGMIEQVIMNLAVNARDAMPEGGRLVVATSAREVEEDEAARHPDALPGRYVRLTVSDNGPGIAPDVLPRLFEPFFTTKPVGKGTGLGLASAYGIARQHRGWIEVESPPGGGTAFHLYLPTGEPSLDRPNIAPPLLGMPRGSETVLVVEDESAVRHLVCDLLQRRGYSVISAPTGVDALEIWKSHNERIDMVLTDLIMPGGMSGRELAERLREERPELKVVFTSGYSSDIADRGEGFLGRGHFLQKPFTPSSLASVVRQCLDGE